MKKALMAVSVVLAVAGLFAGILYIIWCQFLSGDSAGEHEISPGTPVRIALAREMNPVAFNMKGRWGGFTIRIGGSRSKMRRQSSFRARLSRGGSELWSERFSFSSESDRGSSTTNVKTFELADGEDGEYEFVVTKGHEDRLGVKSLTLKVRRNVTPVDWQVAGPGIGAFVLGIIGVIAAAPRRSS